MWPFRNRAIAPVAQPPPAPTQRFLSFLAPEEISALEQLPAEAILGSFTGEGEAEQFHINPVFVTFLHDMLRQAGPLDEGMRIAARQQADGWLYIIDLRTPDGPQGRVPPVDIIGAFQVVAGEILPESYWACQSHRPWTPDGIMQLPASLAATLVKATRERLASAPQDT